MNRLYVSWLVFALALAAGLAGTSDAAAKDWRQYRSSADFPARVKSIAFSSATIDDRSCTTWGRWSVCFGKTRPLAILVQCNSAACPNLLIKNLVCKNRAVGPQKCTMTLSVLLPNGQNYCDISGAQGHPNPVKIHITCPGDVALE